MDRALGMRLEESCICFYLLWLEFMNAKIANIRLILYTHLRLLTSRNAYHIHIRNGHDTAQESTCMLQNERHRLDYVSYKKY